MPHSRRTILEQFDGRYHRAPLVTGEAVDNLLIDDTNTDNYLIDDATNDVLLLQDA